MGNSASNNLVLNLNESGHITAGSTLSGTVCAVVPPGANTASIGLSLFLIGKEDVKVRYTEQHSANAGASTSVTRYSYAKRDIVRMVIPVLSSGSSSPFQARQYAVPFQVQIPDHLPSSMNHHGDGGYCSIVYKLKAEIKGGWSNPKTELPLTIVAKPPSSAPVSNFVAPVSTNIETMCCIPRGTITIAANVDDTRVGLGETLNVDFGCKNEATVEIQFVKAKVYQKVRWSSGHHHSQSKMSIAENNFDLTGAMPALSKTDQNQFQEDVDNGIRSRGVTDDMYREILSAVRDGSNKVTLHVPYTTCPTYLGSLITVEHKLEILAKTPCGSTDPKIKVPLQIVTPPDDATHSDPSASPMQSVPPVPDGWDSGNYTTLASNAGGGGTTSYGGDVVSGEEEIVVDSFDLPSNLGGPSDYSFPSLLKEIQSSISVKSRLEEMVKDSNWNNLLSSLQPQDVVAILQKVTMEFDQADVAILVASVVTDFGCAYVVAILGSVSDWMRIQFVQKMIPLCADLRQNKSLILNELTDWERVSTEHDFEAALKS